MSKEISANTTLSYYRIVSRLGAGGMGEVWLAEDTRLGRKVAIKLLPVEFTRDADRVRRFMQEAKAASSLNHPNIVAVHDIGESEAGRFIVMELVAGRTLRGVIAQENSLETLLTLGSQMAKALSAAHAAGITHRDIKPENIMVRDDGYVKVLDFGLARLLPTTSGEDSATLAQQTTPGMIMGTVAYMSPEQASGQSASAPSDIFSLGIVLYELLTGQHPFTAESVVGYLHAITLQTPPPPSRLKPEIPAACDALILRMLEKDASQRPTASDIAQALQEMERRGDPTKARHSEGETVLLPTSHAGATTADEGFWVAVLPFKWRGANAELEALAEGLSEDIGTGLSRFSYLRVIARSSTLRYASESGDVRAIGQELGARYVMEGSLRQAGSMLRVAVQLVDASTGAHLWAETYNRSFREKESFEFQDELVPRIVSTVADQSGALVRSMSESLRGRGVGQYSAHEAVLRLFGYLERMTPEEHGEAREILEAAVAAAPGHSGCHAALSVIYWQEYANGFNVRPDPLGRAHAAARQAVAVGPTNHLAHSNLATVLFFQKDFLAFRPAAERALVLNTMDTSTTALLGTLIAYAGDWEYGLDVIERAAQLNPHRPGWYHFPAFHYAYHRQDYRGALESALRFNMPGYFFTHAALAAVYGQIGEQERARAALRELHALVPDFGGLARQEFGKWVDAEHTEHLIDGLRKAGLEVVEAEQMTTPQLADSSGGTDVPPAENEKKQSAIQQTTSSTPSIAVLPFTNMSSDEENEYFCDGLAEELLNALSKIDELKVAARTSAFSFKGKTANVSEIGEKLSVKNVLEGSVRKSGNRLRITVQLVNSSDGFHIWSERYDREMKDIFDLQDEITLAVVDALKLKLFGGKKEAVLKRYTDDAEVHELFLKGRYHAYKYTAVGWKRAIELFEKAIEKQPDYAPAYAGMASCWGCLWFFGIIAAEPAVTNCKTATRRALAIDENLAEAQVPLALMDFFYDWEWEQAEQSFKQAVALNPNNAEALSYYALFLAFEGRFDEAITTGKRSLEIDPLAPLINMNVGWTYFSSGLSDEAFDQAGKMIEIEPEFFGAYWLKGAIYLSEGEYEKAVEELEKAVSLGGHQIVLADLGSAYSLAGQENEAVAILEQLLEMRRQEYLPAICLARIFSRIGENDKAIEWLEKAFEERNGEMVFLQGEIEGAAAGDSLNSLGNDPKLMEILQKMNLPC